MRVRMFRLAFSMIVAVTSTSAQSTTAAGEAILRTMHAQYAGRWYASLTFRQRTTIIRPNQESRVLDWMESMRYTARRGVELRIDEGAIVDGNGTLSTADSTWQVRAGELKSTRGVGNDFLPLLFGIYLDSVQKSIRQIVHIGVDLSRMTRVVWDGRPTWVVGVTSTDDASRSQIWIDSARAVLVRVIFVPANRTRIIDARLTNFQAIGDGWVATKIEMLIDGSVRQVEEYYEVRTDHKLGDDYFDVNHWTPAKHWASTP
jgi:hypothetical protein